MPFPFGMVQTRDHSAVLYEYAHGNRIIDVDGSKHVDGIEYWMGDSSYRWEGDAPVVDVQNLNDQTWFDRSR
jgi:hypothetical protein